MMVKKIVLIVSLSFSLFAGDIMVERMQSVVDEVSELRHRYEDAVHKNEQCLAQVKKQNILLSQKGLNPRADKEKIAFLEDENLRLKQAHQTAKQENGRSLELQADVNRLSKDNKRLNTSAQILVEKNQSLLEQLNTLKRNKEEPANIAVLMKDKQNLQKDVSLQKKKIKSLEKSKLALENKINTSKASASSKVVLLQEKNKKLLKDLAICENRSKSPVPIVKNVCIDDNPFPKLLTKETKSIKKQVQVQINKSKTSTKKSSVYRIKGESAVYDSPNGKVIEVWEDTRSFTSDFSNGKWIKITGFFVNKKWRKSSLDMWVKEENTLKR